MKVRVMKGNNEFCAKINGRYETGHESQRNR